MQRVLITGGSGFLGKNLAIALKDSYEVFLGSRNHASLKRASQATDCEIVPLDVTNIFSVKDAFAFVNPNIVIHAAATKYVDWSEVHPHEAIDVNVLGGLNIYRACLDNSIHKLVFISTDKASPPVVNTYGLSKAIIERSYALSGKSEEISVVSVRYGNVLWSTGSFLHAWEEMLSSNNNLISSTGSTMTRFFFTVHDATSLVLLVLKNIDSLKGSIVSLPMKTATISEFLHVFCDIHSANYKLVGQRGGERNQEYLIGDAELEFSSSITVDNTPLYQIIPNIPSESPLATPVCSSTSPRLTLPEIRNHILTKPPIL